MTNEYFYFCDFISKQEEEEEIKLEINVLKKVSPIQYVLVSDTRVSHMYGDSSSEIAKIAYLWEVIVCLTHKM